MKDIGHMADLAKERYTDKLIDGLTAIQDRDYPTPRERAAKESDFFLAILQEAIEQNTDLSHAILLQGFYVGCESTKSDVAEMSRYQMGVYFYTLIHDYLEGME